MNKHHLLWLLLLVGCSKPPSPTIDYQCLDRDNKPSSFWPDVPADKVRMKSDDDWIIIADGSRDKTFYYYTPNGEFYNVTLRSGEVCYPVQRVEAGGPRQAG